MISQALDATQQRLVETLGLPGRFAQGCDARNVGAVVSKSPTYIKAYDLTSAQLSIGRLNVHQRAALTKADASQYWERAIFDRLNMKRARQIKFRRTFPSHAQRRLDRAFGNSSDMPQPVDLVVRLHGSNLAQQRCGRRDSDVRQTRR